jgi:phosphoglycolate phosphatase-like HAD superfamily hydrolase
VRREGSWAPPPEGTVAAAPLAILFDVDGTLISTGGAGTRSWRWAFEVLYGVPADIGEFSEAGMTDPEVARRTFRNVIGRQPTEREMARLLAAYLERLPQEVETSKQYRVLPGAEALLGRLCRESYLVGIVTGALEAAAHIKLARARLNRFFAFGGYGSDSGSRTDLTRRAMERAGAILEVELDPASVYVVGDTPKDMEAALGVGAVAIGVASGHYSAEALRKAGAQVVLASLEEPMPGLKWSSGERT